MAKAIPEGYTALTPYLIVRDAKKALAFYAEAFGAVELYRLPMGDRIGHAEMQIGDARFMLADESPQVGAVAPAGDGRGPVSFLLYTEDCDATFKRALNLGAKELRPVTDQFYGDRTGQLMDPFGHTWSVSTHVEDVTPEEMERRMAAMPPPAQG
jgi:PhnB protein